METARRRKDKRETDELGLVGTSQLDWGIREEGANLGSWSRFENCLVQSHSNYTHAPHVPSTRQAMCISLPPTTHTHTYINIQGDHTSQRNDDK